MNSKKPWFDPETGVLLLDEYVAEMASFRKIMADEVVTEQELQEHANLVVQKLQHLETMLSAEAKLLTTEALCEIAVLYQLQRLRGL